MTRSRLRGTRPMSFRMLSGTWPGGVWPRFVALWLGQLSVLARVQARQLRYRRDSIDRYDCRWVGGHTSGFDHVAAFLFAVPDECYEVFLKVCRSADRDRIC
jgi:hypothetical protein